MNVVDRIQETLKEEDILFSWERVGSRWTITIHGDNGYGEFFTKVRFNQVMTKVHKILQEQE